MTDAGFDEMLASSAGCFGLHGVGWQRSHISTDGSRTFCWFKAPDVESMRQALHKTGSSGRAWGGTVHDAPGPDAPPLEAANVVVERSWPEPVTLPAIQAIEDDGAWCLQAYDVQFVRTYFATDQKRMLCLYRAPDAEAVRSAQHKAGMPVDSVWSFRLRQP